MSYYIAPQPKSGDWMTQELVIYRVVNRLSDFKAEDGKTYRVFKSKKEMNDSLYIPLYVGVNGRLKKSKSDFVLRF